MTDAVDAESKVRDVLIDTYYSDRVRVGSDARTRAHAAQSIVTIFAGALVAAFTFTSLGDRAIYTQISGCLTVAAWLTAAILYVRAVATPVPPPIGTGRARTEPSEVIRALLEQADHERSNIDRRQLHANRASITALALTILTFVLMLFAGASGETARGELALNAAGRQAVSSTCGTQVDRLVGEVVKSTVNSPFIAVVVRKCGSQSGVRVFIPRDGVAGLYFKEG